MRVFSHRYVVSRFRDGKRQGLPQEFEFLGDAEEFARRAAFEEVFDPAVGQHVRRPVPIHVVPWTEKLAAYQDGITLEDVGTCNAGNACAERVYEMLVEPKPSPGPTELKGMM
jgi:hypothetical protein